MFYMLFIKCACSMSFKSSFVTIVHDHCLPLPARITTVTTYIYLIHYKSIHSMQLIKHVNVVTVVITVSNERK